VTAKRKVVTYRKQASRMASFGAVRHDQEPLSNPYQTHDLCPVNLYLLRSPTEGGNVAERSQNRTSSRVTALMGDPGKITVGILDAKGTKPVQSDRSPSHRQPIRGGRDASGFALRAAVEKLKIGFTD
jgi:hypothetical protein